MGILRVLWRGLGFARRSLVWLVVLLLLVTNILTLTSSAFVALISAGATAMGVTTVHAQDAARRLARRTTVSRIAARTARSAARSAASVLPQSLPWIGAGAVVTFTGWELYDACQTMRDLADLDGDAGLSAEEDSVCGMPYPAFPDITTGWAGDLPPPPPPR